MLAAGLGTRMRPITDTIPKPLVEVGGKPLIAYSLEALERLGVGTIVVNVHYLADVLTDWLDRRTGARILISDEREQLLDSGGAVVHALPQLGNQPLLLLNADTFWVEDPAAGRGNLAALQAGFDPERMDILMLTARPDQATGHSGPGDFFADADNRLKRFRGDGEPLIYAGALILHPRIFAGISERVFSLNRCFDAAIAAGRLHGLPLAGHWLTVGTPQAIGEAESAMRTYFGRPAS
ncbi:MurNAc alpha-1-phosphate uridylyltransferase [Hoeflea marina]|uniref:MurNAc alpha-1-phosphate uridylyltransferase n=1 Tax=Hoeflea marina TaxID=274592 RepID=A0A317PJJ2_9HYPH|nr:MurNAc alpha-1-phosphate uridylyltransferase [Hoeflea marina]